MNIMNGIMCAVVLLLVPICGGYAACHWFRLPRDLPHCYLAGCMAQWAMLQLICVPMTLLKMGFEPLVWVVSAGFALMAACGLALFIKALKSHADMKADRQRPAWNGADVFALVLMIVGCLCLLYACGRMQHIDRDDARFVVTAVDIEHTNRLFLTDYGTGAAIDDFAGPLRHDLFSPWVVYFAYVARVSSTPVAIVAHTAFPQTLMLCLFCVYWLMSGRFFGERRFERYGMVFLALLVTAYSGYATMATEGYFVRRPWQGKATVAGIGIPTLYLALTRIWSESRRWRNYLLMYMVIMAMCFMSAMGIILSSVMCGAFGLAYGIRKRSLTVALKTWGGALICLSYVGVMLLRMR